MTYIVFDAETTVRNAEGVGSFAVGEEKGSPFHPENKVVLAGWKIEGEDHVEVDEEVCLLNSGPKVDLLVGHNIRFDMHYLDKHDPEFTEWLSKPENSVWDTQIVEYLLTAQQHKFAKLDDLAMEYGGTLKDSDIKAFWDNGGQTEDLPREKLEPYLIGDVENTERVFLAQRQLAEECGMLPLIKTQMRALVATWEMRRNGMCFNLEKASLEATKLDGKVELLADRIKSVLESKHPKAEAGSVLPTSADALSRYLFGGSYKYYEQVPILDEMGSPVVFKSGKKKGEIRTKKTERLDYIKGLCIPDPEWQTKKVGVYQVGDFQLNTLLRQGVDKEAESLIEDVLKLRALEKDRTTYFVGYSKLAWPEKGKWFIHGDLNLCQTNTGRLSSSKPNMQNLSGKDRD